MVNRTKVRMGMGVEDVEGEGGDEEVGKAGRKRRMRMDGGPRTGGGLAYCASAAFRDKTHKQRGRCNQEGPLRRAGRLACELRPLTPDQQLAMVWHNKFEEVSRHGMISGVGAGVGKAVGVGVGAGVGSSTFQTTS